MDEVILIDNKVNIKTETGYLDTLRVITCITVIIFHALLL
jgi:hypothetical protein